MTIREGTLIAVPDDEVGETVVDEVFDRKAAARYIETHPLGQRCDKFTGRDAGDNLIFTARLNALTSLLQLLRQRKSICAGVGTFFLLGLSSSYAQMNKSPSPSAARSNCMSEVRFSGERVEYPAGAGASGVVWEFAEYRTGNNLELRIRRNAGGLGNPDNQCRFRSGSFRYWWTGDQLLPDFDLRTGRVNSDRTTFDETNGTSRKPVMVEFFVRFPTIENSKREKVPDSPWNEEDAFDLPAFSHIKVLPHGSKLDSAIPKVRMDDPATWRPVLRFSNVIDASGKPVVFTCSGLRFKRQAGQVVAVPLDNIVMNCSSGFFAAPEVGGRMRVYDNDFLRHGARLTNSLMSEIGTYLVEN